MEEDGATLSFQQFADIWRGSENRFNSRSLSQWYLPTSNASFSQQTENDSLKEEAEPLSPSFHQFQFFQLLWDAFIWGSHEDKTLLEEARQADIQRRAKSLLFLKNNNQRMVAVFMLGSKSRQLIAERLLKLYDEHTSMQPHVLQLLKLLITSLLAAADQQFHNAAQCVCNIFDVCIRLIPTILDFGTYLDLVTEFSKPLPIMSLPILVRYLGRKQSVILNEYRRLDQSLKGDKKRMQTFGAKFVGLVKALEERLSNTSKMHHIFTLRRLLIECLPLTHAGVTNKLSVHRAEMVEPQIDSKAAWQQLAVWEASENTSTSVTSSCFSDKQSLSSLRATDTGCPYNVYEAYCHLQEFLQQPQLVQLRPPEYLKHIHDSFGYVFKYFQKKRIASSTSYIFDARATAFEITSAAAFREAIDEAFFRKEFLLKACLAFQTLSVPHKKETLAEATTPTPIIESLDEKSKRLVSDLISQVWKAVQAFEGFEEATQQRLIKEYLWITWKQLGCSDTVLVPHHVDTVGFCEREDDTFPPPATSALNEQQLKEFNEIKKFMNFFEEWEDGVDQHKEANSEFSMIEYPQLRREAAEWYIEKKNPVPPSYSTDALSNKLAHKLQDYRVKMREDDDPVNEIEEAEKSKYNAVFRFRLSRLFFMKYIDTYYEMSNTDTMDGKVDALIRAMDAHDGNQLDLLNPKAKLSGKKRRAPVSADAAEDTVNAVDSGSQLLSPTYSSKSQKTRATGSMHHQNAAGSEEEGVPVAAGSPSDSTQIENCVATPHTPEQCDGYVSNASDEMKTNAAPNVVDEADGKSDGVSNTAST